MTSTGAKGQAKGQVLQGSKVAQHSASSPVLQAPLLVEAHGSGTPDPRRRGSQQGEATREGAGTPPPPVPPPTSTTSTAGGGGPSSAGGMGGDSAGKRQKVGGSAERGGEGPSQDTTRGGELEGPSQDTTRGGEGASQDTTRGGEGPSPSQDTTTTHPAMTGGDAEFLRGGPLSPASSGSDELPVTQQQTSNLKQFPHDAICGEIYEAAQRVTALASTGKTTVPLPGAVPGVGSIMQVLGACNVTRDISCQSMMIVVDPALLQCHDFSQVTDVYRATSDAYAIMTRCRDEYKLSLSIQDGADVDPNWIPSEFSCLEDWRHDSNKAAIAARSVHAEAERAARGFFYAKVRTFPNLSSNQLPNPNPNWMAT
jgi:hypothetical protein